MGEDQLFLLLDSGRAGQRSRAAVSCTNRTLLGSSANHHQGGGHQKLVFAHGKRVWLGSAPAPFHHRHKPTAACWYFFIFDTFGRTMDEEFLRSSSYNNKKKKPYKELTLKEKVELIRLAEENVQMSQASIADRYEIAKSNVCRILQRKAEYLTAFNSSNFSVSRKRKLKCNEDGNETLRTHMYKQHQISRMFMCRCCNWAFPDKTSLHIHVQATQSGKAVHVPVIGRGSSYSAAAPAQPTLGLLPPNLTMPLFEAAIPMAETATKMVLEFAQQPTWLNNLPRPVPTTEPMFVKNEEEIIVDDDEDDDATKICSTSSLCSPESSIIKNRDEPSAFREARRGMSPTETTSSISPSRSCSECQRRATRCQYLEETLQKVQSERTSQQTTLETALLNMHQELTILRQHNQMFQAKLVDCQTSALRFLQSDKISDVSEAVSVMNKIVAATLVG